MTNTQSYAQRELDILIKTTPDAIIRDFVPEILALCEKFGNSGQSGGSAPYTASALSQAIKKLCLQEPICPVTGIDEEWFDVSLISDEPDGTLFQNNRYGSIFKQGKLGRAYYLDAIIFKGETSQFISNGSVSDSKGIITSRQYIKSFPFTPKRFYVDVIETEWADKTETVKQKGGGWWTSVLKDEKQLEAIWKYYDRFSVKQ